MTHSAPPGGPTGGGALPPPSKPTDIDLTGARPTELPEDTPAQEPADAPQGRPADEPADKAAGKEEGKGTFISTLSQWASLATAALAIFATLFATVTGLSSPADVRAGVRSTVWRYRVTITSPTHGTAIQCPAPPAPGKQAKPAELRIAGTAKMPRDWDLLVFVQTPDQLRYYVAGEAAVAVKPNGTWAVDDVQLGGKYPDDCNMPYKLFAILATREGQQQFLERLKDLDTGPWLPGLPHHGPEAIATVTLEPPSAASVARSQRP